MKGFIIYEDFITEIKSVVNCGRLSPACYTCRGSANDVPEATVSGGLLKTTTAICSGGDKYDFETGALIALMKMCGFDKAYKAIEEAFKYNSYDAKKTKELEEENINLKKRINKLENYNNQLEDRVAAEQRGGYMFLKDMEKLQEKFNKKVSDLRDQIHENSRLIQTNGELKDKVKELEEKIATKNKDIDHLLEENKKLQHEYDLCLNSENALKCSVDYLNKSIAKLNTAIYRYKDDLYKATKRCEELELKEDILNKQEETINKREEKMSVYFGGRENGKQYKALVELFKKLDQKKVDAAYKEAYNTKLPLWQKEVLNQMYNVYKETKDKTELPRTLDINGIKYRKMLQIKDFSNDQLDSLIEGSRAYTRKFDNEWLYKIPTKREEMWEKIFALHKESDVIIKVKKEDVNTFLHELENKIPEITWLSTVKIFETKYTIGDIYEELKTCDAIYFRLSTETKLSYSSDPHIFPYRELKYIDYLPPMRWDLFRKGRIYVKLDAKHFDEFKQACIKELGISPNTGYFNGEMIVINIPKEERFVITRDLKGFKARKIINWEDVR